MQAFVFHLELLGPDLRISQRSNCYIQMRIVLNGVNVIGYHPFPFECCRCRSPISLVGHLLLPLDCRDGHLHQSFFGLAVGEVPDTIDCLLCIILCQRSGLLNTFCLEDDLPCLHRVHNQSVNHV